VNAADQRRRNGQHYVEQRVIDPTKNWTVGVHVRSESTNPDRFTKQFATQSEATGWVSTVFGNVVVSSL